MKRLRLTPTTTRQEMADQMGDLMPAILWQLLQKIGDVAAENNLPLYLVGGIVRDLWLGKSSVDIDLVVVGDAIHLAQTVQEKLAGAVQIHNQFGTAKWLPELPAPIPIEIDFVTARSEHYPHPTALPVVEPSTIEADLRRRDFSINTLAIRLDGDHLGTLLDLHNGLDDLAEGVIRVLHRLSFTDDPTRIIRAVRFEQRLKFSLEMETDQQLRQALPLLKKVTGARIRHEIELSLLESNPVTVLRRLDELGVLTQLHPDLGWSEGMVEAFREMPAFLQSPLWQPALKPNDPLVINFTCWLHPHPPHVKREFCARLKVRNTTLADVLATSQLVQSLLALDSPLASDIVVIIRTHAVRPRVVLGAYGILWGLLGAEMPALWLETYQRQWQHEKTILNGNDLLAMGVPQGKIVGDLLAQLLAKRLDNQIKTIDDEKAWVQAQII